MRWLQSHQPSSRGRPLQVAQRAVADARDALAIEQRANRGVIGEQLELGSAVLPRVGDGLHFLAGSAA